MNRRYLFFLLFLGCVSFIPGIPSFLRVICGLAQTVYLPGLVFLLLFWDRRAPALDTIFIPPLIAPIVLSLLVAALFTITHALEISVTVAILILYGLLAAALVFKNRCAASEDAMSIPRGVAIIALLFGGMVGVLYLLNPYLMARSDVLHHGPIVTGPST